MTAFTDSNPSEFEVKTSDGYDPVCQVLLQHDIAVITFRGDLGAGKTTLIKSLCRTLGCQDEVTSPTFSLVNEYRDSNGNPVYHIDLYRLNTIEEALQMGIQEYLDSGHRCLIEWPEIIAPLLRQIPVLQTEISVLPDGTRRIRTLN